MKNTKRNTAIDQAAGLMIVVVIIGHTFDWLGLCDTLVWKIVLWLFYFFMPWFFFKSGMFYNDKPFKEVVKKGFHTLIIPFLSIGLISLIISFIRNVFIIGSSVYAYFRMVGVAIVLHGGIPGNSALWFLTTLFFVRILYCVMHNRIHDGFIMLITFVILLLNFVLKSKYVFLTPYLSLPDYLYNSLSGLFFFSAGHLLARKQYETPIAVIAVIVYIIIAIFRFSYVDVFHNRVVFGSYVLWFISSLCGVVWLNNFFQISNKKILFRILKYLGENSFTFFATHFIVGNIAWLLVINPLHLENMYVQLAVYLTSYVIVLPAFNRLFHTKRMLFIIGKSSNQELCKTE
jgi:fucose 4-O-acetylase-like acetyltransferase